jgi:hypothetical protein
MSIEAMKLALVADAQRAAFEQFWVTEIGDKNDLTYGGLGYAINRVEVAWKAWKTAAQPAPVQEPTWSWECNECGSKEFTSNVSESDLDFLACAGCGCNEFHKAYTTPHQRSHGSVRRHETGRRRR